MPATHGNWTLVLLHGRGSGPSSFLGQQHVWPGGHDNAYWHSHLRQYFAFYVRHCA